MNILLTKIARIPPW